MMYGDDDLGSSPLFGGGFINFGYWRDTQIGELITEQQRVESQQALYRLALDSLQVSGTDELLEVGSGIGTGAALAVAEFGARSVYGVDMNPQQIARANQRNADLVGSGRLEFLQAAAANLPLADDAVTCLLSVEALQHMDELGAFAREARRVLAPGGRFAATTFFAQSVEGTGEIARRINTFASGVDVAHPVAMFTDELAQAGFTSITTQSIGEYVWPQLDRWIQQLDGPPWTRQWLACFQDGLLDYYLVTA